MRFWSETVKFQLSGLEFPREKLAHIDINLQPACTGLRGEQHPRGVAVAASKSVSTYRLRKIAWPAGALTPYTHHPRTPDLQRRMQNTHHYASLASYRGLIPCFELAWQKAPRISSVPRVLPASASPMPDALDRTV